MEENLVTESFSFIGLLFKKEVAIGDLLTSITIMASFIVWFFSSIKKRREENRKEQKSGALRFLLKILREKDNKIFSFDELKSEFDSDSRKEERVAYCGKKFKYKNNSEFEAAIYQLDWESKIDFVSTNTIKFRTDTHINPHIGSVFEILGDEKVGEIQTELFEKIKSKTLSYEEEKVLRALGNLPNSGIKKSLIKIV